MVYEFLFVKAFRKFCTLLLAVVALLAPLAEMAHCDDAHAEECSAECVCACHCPTPLASHEPTIDVGLSEGHLAGFGHVLAGGRLAPADIFRPPACA